ncbi:MAG: FKBP-type peptidyl-prolyl cis-trans isomerase [Bacteroidales bacterium]|nr:FKBP-type peptidyl-prolyl cis-trans isomerase [Bacteroidales bacterium]
MEPAAGRDTIILSNVTPTTQDELASYMLGVSIANGMKQQKIPIQLEHMAKGFQEVMTNDPNAKTAEEANAFLQKYSQELTQRVAAQNLAKGNAFLAENKTREGIVETASGLQYKVLKAGSGPKPGLDDKVKCHYRGTLLDGTEFDSSYKRGQPAEFPVKGVIKGWIEGLQLMNVGSKYELFIPAALAYGERGTPAMGPNEVLIFEIELLEILPYEAPQQQPQMQVQPKLQMQPKQ